MTSADHATKRSDSHNKINCALFFSYSWYVLIHILKISFINKLNFKSLFTENLIVHTFRSHRFTLSCVLSANVSVCILFGACAFNTLLFKSLGSVIFVYVLKIFKTVFKVPYAQQDCISLIKNTVKQEYCEILLFSVSLYFKCHFKCHHFSGNYFTSVYTSGSLRPVTNPNAAHHAEHNKKITFRFTIHVFIFTLIKKCTKQI